MENNLEICVINPDTGMLYEWNGSQMVNVYDTANYANCLETGAVPHTYDAWTMSECRGAEDFIASVVEHVKGDSDHRVG